MSHEKKKVQNWFSGQLGWYSRVGSQLYLAGNEDPFHGKYIYSPPDFGAKTARNTAQQKIAQKVRAFADVTTSPT